MQRRRVKPKPRCAWCGCRYAPFPLEPHQMRVEDAAHLCQTCLEWAEIIQVEKENAEESRRHRL